MAALPNTRGSISFHFLKMDFCAKPLFGEKYFTDLDKTTKITERSD